MNEPAIIEHLRKMAGPSPSLVLGIGDDCAVYRPPKGEDLVFTTDMLLENVHFRQATHKPSDIGYKALARGLSDVAAMGATPRFCLVSLALGEALPVPWLGAFYRGLLALARKHNLPLAGGDLARADKIYCDIVVCGSVPPGSALRRDGAKAGDEIFVSGSLGGSALGLSRQSGAAWKKHIRPEPRVALGLALRKTWRATAAIDLSDGLSLDLHRLAKASGLAAELEAKLPVYPSASLEQALHGGEDYELLFTLPAAAKPPGRIEGIRITRIGIMRSGSPGNISYAGRRLAPRGYDHFRNPCTTPQ
jgi:thiamine-monophosphate kinase